MLSLFIEEATYEISKRSYPDEPDATYDVVKARIVMEN